MNKIAITTAVFALVAGFGIGYYLPHGTGNVPSAPPSSFRSGFARGSGGNGFLSGTIVGKDSESITVSTNDGNSHLVLVTPDTGILKSVSGNMNNLAIGSAVIVSGPTNSDGSISASLIQIRPTGIRGSTTTPAQ